MRGAIAVIALAVSTPAMADSFSLTQLLGYGFDVEAAIAGPAGDSRTGSTRSDTLYLKGRIPSGSQDILVRCVVRDRAADSENNCQQVY